MTDKSARNVLAALGFGSDGDVCYSWISADGLALDRACRTKPKSGLLEAAAQFGGDAVLNPGRDARSLIRSHHEIERPIQVVDQDAHRTRQNGPISAPIASMYRARFKTDKPACGPLLASVRPVICWLGL
jgi:hypothetical protein